MERIAHLGPYRDDTDLEVFRLDDGEIEFVVNGARRVRLQPGDHLALHAKWEFWELPMCGCDTAVTLVRGDQQIPLTSFEFDIMWGGWLPDKIQEELQKVCSVVLTKEEQHHR